MTQPRNHEKPPADPNYDHVFNSAAGPNNGSTGTPPDAETTQALPTGVFADLPSKQDTPTEAATSVGQQFTVPSAQPSHHIAGVQERPAPASAPPNSAPPVNLPVAEDTPFSLPSYSPPVPSEHHTAPHSPAPIQNDFYPQPRTGPTYPNPSPPTHPYGPNFHPGPPPGLSTPHYPGSPPSRGGSGKLVGITVVVALVAISAIGTGLFFLLRNDNGSDDGGSSSKSDKATPVQVVKSLLTAMEEGDADKVKDLYCHDPQDDSRETITGNLQEGDSYSVTNYEVGDTTEGSDGYTIEVRVEYIWTDDGTEKSFTEDLELTLINEKAWKICGLNPT